MFFEELDRDKKRVFLVVLTFTAVAGIGFACLNYYRNLIALATVELITAFISMWLWIHVNKTSSVRNFKRLALIYVTVFFCIMMFAISSKGVSITIFAWVLVIPLTSYLLLGVKLGFIITAVFYSIATFLFFGGYTAHPVLIEKAAYGNIFVCALLYWGVSHSYELSNQSFKLKLQRMAVSDHLTGLYNRTTMSQLFKATIEQAQLTENTVSLVLFDLDNFKKINDRFGHETGDQVLIKFSEILQSSIEKIGVAFRIGGEEFAIMFATNSEIFTLSLTERIRQETEKIIIDETSSDLNVSVSAGVVTSQPNKAVLSEMMVTADRRMYQGKSQGRNVVIHHG